jgi:hypothetical protein
VAAAHTDGDNAYFCAPLRWAVLEHALYAAQDALAAPFVVAAALFPWRAAAVLADYRAIAANDAALNYSCALRVAGVQHFAYAVLDVLLLVPLVMAAMLPWRTAAVWRHLLALSRDAEHLPYAPLVRAAIVTHCAHAVVDVLLLPFGVIAVILPHRTAAVITHLKSCADADEPHSAYCASMRWAIVSHCFYALADVLCLPALLVAVALPHRVAPVVQHLRMIRFLLHRGDANVPYCVEMRTAAIAHAGHTLIDLFVAPFLLVAVILPHRTWPVLRHLAATQEADAQSTYCFATRAAVLANAWYAVQDVLLAPLALVALLPPFTVRSVAHFAAVVAADAPDSFYCEALRGAVVFQVPCRAVQAMMVKKKSQS